MGRGSGLWDDSALVDAFDHAMATYKVMHGESSVGSTLKEENDKNDENEPTSAETREPELTDAPNDEPKEASETQVSDFEKQSTGQDFPVEEDSVNPTLWTIASEPNLSGVPATAVITDKHPHQPSVDCDQLLKKYYELEGQKQKIVELLQQANYWNYQTSFQSGEYEAQQVPVNSTSGNCIYPSCSLCSAYCLAPLIPVTGCATGGMPSGGHYCCPISCSVSHGHPDKGCQYPVSSGNSVGIACAAVTETQSTHVDHEVIKIGMIAAQKALNVTREGPSASNIGEEKKGKDEDRFGEHESKIPEDISQDTDLAVVLSAWYSAGFHTGRYLSEQAKKKA